jgi:hypothetical protein
VSIEAAAGPGTGKEVVMEEATRLKKILVILAHALVGWALCGAIMAIGPAVTSMETALIIHAVGAPIIFAAVSLVYFTRFNYTTPAQTAVIFVAFVILMDFFLVSWLILGNFEMFASPLGTWIPFVLIFTSTYLTGLYVTHRSETVTA